MAKPPITETHLIDGPAGNLEMVLEIPSEAPPTACSVICHPHPVHGGTMTNKVVHTLARAFVTEGFASLRFNFRGAGKSEGSFDDGKGEVDDVLAAIAWLKAKYPDLTMWLAGFSFGGAMAIHAAVKVGAAGLVSVAPAIYRFAGDGTSLPECPWLIVQGDQDELVDINETIEYVNSIQPGPQLAVFPEAEHFFHGRLVELRHTVATFIKDNRT